MSPDEPQDERSTTSAGDTNTASQGGVVVTGRAANINTGSGDQYNIPSVQAGRDAIIGSTINQYGTTTPEQMAAERTAALGDYLQALRRYCDELRFATPSGERRVPLRVPPWCPCC